MLNEYCEYIHSPTRNICFGKLPSLIFSSSTRIDKVHKSEVDLKRFCSFYPPFKRLFELFRKISGNHRKESVILNGIFWFISIKVQLLAHIFLNVLLHDVEFTASSKLDNLSK